MENIEEIIAAYNPEESWAGKIIKRISDTPIRIHRKGFLALQKHFATKVYNYKADAEEEMKKIGELVENTGHPENVISSYILARHIKRYNKFNEKAASYNDLLVKPVDLTNSSGEIMGELGASEMDNSTMESISENIETNESLDLSNLPENNPEEVVQEENVGVAEEQTDAEYEYNDAPAFDEVYSQILELLVETPELKENLEILMATVDEDKKFETLHIWVEDNVAFEVENAKIYALLDGGTEEEMIEQMNNATSLDKTEENETVSEELSGIDETAEESFENGEGFIPEEIENPETEIVDGEQAIEETTVDDAELEQSQSEDEFEKPEFEQPMLEGFEEAMEAPVEVAPEVAPENAPVEEEIIENPEEALEQVSEEEADSNDIQEEESSIIDSETMLHGNNFYGANFEEDISNPNENAEDIEWLVNEVNRAYEEEYEKELTEKIAEKSKMLLVDEDDLDEKMKEKISEQVKSSLHEKYESALSAAEKEEYQQQISVLERERDELEEDLAKSNADLQSANATKTKIRRENDKYKKERKKIIEKQEILEKENDGLKQDKKDLMDALKKSKNEYDNQVSINKKREEQIDKLQAELESLKAEFTALRKFVGKTIFDSYMSGRESSNEPEEYEESSSKHL